MELGILPRVDIERVRSSDMGRAWRDPLCGGGFGRDLAGVNWGTFSSARVVLRVSRRKLTKGVPSSGPSIDSARGFGLGFGLALTGCGVSATSISRDGTLVFGSLGMLTLIVRCGLGDCIGGGAVCETMSGSAEMLIGVVDRAASNIFTSELVGGMGLSSVATFSTGWGTTCVTERDPVLLPCFLGAC
jgi:hypothetical protein